jgi:type VI protein secretion system component VasK
MDPTYIISAAIITAVILICAAVWIWRLTSAMGVIRAGKTESERRLAVEEEKASRIPSLETSLKEKTKEADEFREAKTSVEREFATLNEGSLADQATPGSQ